MGLLKSRRGTAYNYRIRVWALESEISNKKSEHLHFRELTDHCHSASLVQGTPANIRTNLIFLKLQSLIYILPLAVFVYLHSNFSGGLRKTIFSARVRMGRSRSSKVTDFSTNRKRVCDFLLVRHSNFGPILHRFWHIAAFTVLLTTPLFHPNFGGVPVAPDR